MSHAVFNDSNMERKVAFLEKKLQTLRQKRLKLKRQLGNLMIQIAKLEKKLDEVKSDLMD